MMLRDQVNPASEDFKMVPFDPQTKTVDGLGDHKSDKKLLVGVGILVHVNPASLERTITPLSPQAIAVWLSSHLTAERNTSVPE